MSVLAYIGIGSNMGDKKANCLRAIELLRTAGTVRAVSSLYRTEPVGYAEQDDFINAVAAIETELSPRELLACCLSIESQLGRKRTRHWGPRSIDLDILLFGEQVVSDADLTIPHQFMAVRKFVLAPLAEIAPEALHPVLKKNMQQLLHEVQDTSMVTRCRADRESP